MSNILEFPSKVTQRLTFKVTMNLYINFNFRNNLVLHENVRYHFGYYQTNKTS